MERGPVPRERPGAGSDADTPSGKKRRTKADDNKEDLTAFKLSDYTDKRVTLNYKQLRLDENLDRGQVCLSSRTCSDCGC